MPAGVEAQAAVVWSNIASLLDEAGMGPADVVSVTSYVDSTVAPNTTYSYTVTAQDAAGNVSAPSNALLVTTPNPATAISVDRMPVFRRLAPNEIAVAGDSAGGGLAMSVITQAIAADLAGPAALVLLALVRVASAGPVTPVRVHIECEQEGRTKACPAFLLGFAAGAESDLIAFLAARYFGMAHQIVLALLPCRRLHGFDGACAERQFVIRDHEAVVHTNHTAKATASLARAVGGVE